MDDLRSQASTVWGLLSFKSNYKRTMDVFSVWIWVEEIHFGLACDIKTLTEKPITKRELSIEVIMHGNGRGVGAEPRTHSRSSLHDVPSLLCLREWRHRVFHPNTSMCQVDRLQLMMACIHFHHQSLSTLPLSRLDQIWP